MPRLTDPHTASFTVEVREFLATLPQDPMVKMMSLSIGSVKPFVELAKALFTGLELPPRSREMVILMVAELTGSAFVAAQHVPMALAAGVAERTQQLISNRDIRNSELSPYDRSLLRYTAEIVRQPRVPDGVFAKARGFLSDRELVEVLQVVGYYWSFGRIATTLDVEVTAIYSDQPVLVTPDAAPEPGSNDLSPG